MKLVLLTIKPEKVNRRFIWIVCRPNATPTRQNSCSAWFVDIFDPVPTLPVSVNQAFFLLDSSREFGLQVLS
jgi:hypothetical protein